MDIQDGIASSGLWGWIGRGRRRADDRYSRARGFPRVQNKSADAPLGFRHVGHHRCDRGSRLGRITEPSPSQTVHARHVAHTAGGIPFSLSNPDWVTATATTILALGAIVTAVFASLAFRKQSEEVRTLKDQLTEQSKESGLLERRVRLQQEFNEQQVPVLALQAKELQESLDERLRDRQQRRSAQAAQVLIWKQRFEEDPHNPAAVYRPTSEAQPVVVAHVENSSSQPIYDLAISWRAGGVPAGVPDQIGTSAPPRCSATVNACGGEQCQTAGSMRSRQAKNHRASGWDSPSSCARSTRFGLSGIRASRVRGGRFGPSSSSRRTPDRPVCPPSGAASAIWFWSC
jgi:hypothetical protein